MPSRAEIRLWVRPASAIVLAMLMTISAPSAGAATVSAARVTRDSCDGPSHWRLAGHLESPGVVWVRLSIKGGRSGQQWNVFMDDNGIGFFAGSRISGNDGSVVVIRRTDDLPGRDHVRVAAHNVDTAEICRGRIVI